MLELSAVHYVSDEKTTPLTHGVHQLTQWAAELLQRLQTVPEAQPQQNQTVFAGKELRIDKFGGSGYHNWTDDITTIHGVTN